LLDFGSDIYSGIAILAPKYQYLRKVGLPYALIVMGFIELLVELGKSWHRWVYAEHRPMRAGWDTKLDLSFQVSISNMRELVAAPVESLPTPATESSVRTSDLETSLDERATSNMTHHPITLPAIDMRINQEGQQPPLKSEKSLQNEVLSRKVAELEAEKHLAEKQAQLEAASVVIQQRNYSHLNALWAFPRFSVDLICFGFNIAVIVLQAQHEGVEWQPVLACASSFVGAIIITAYHAFQKLPAEEVRVYTTCTHALLIRGACVHYSFLLNLYPATFCF
jgi:hypothetical protein